MSSQEDKVTAVTAFLINRAQLRRVTSHEELQRVTGQLLYNGGRRAFPGPVSRKKIVDVLKVVDDASMADKGVMLSALVTHFWDNGITGRFFESAIERGLLTEDSDSDDRSAFAAGHRVKIYNAYPVTDTPLDLSELFPQDESGDYEDIDEDVNA